MIAKRLNLIIVLVLLSVTLFGCAPQASPQQTSAPEQVESTSAPVATSAPEQVEAPTTAPPTSAPAQAEEQKCVRIGAVESSGEKMSMDPSILWTSGADGPYIYGVYERLVDVTSNFEVVPELAEKWESNEDGSEWTFHLREGIKFHDGSDFDAADVVYSYQRILDPATGSSGLAVLDPVLSKDGIVAVDPLTVVFRTKAPTANLPLILSTKETGIVPEGAKSEDLRLQGVGTGPFMQEVFEPGSAYTKLVANPNYWQLGLPAAPCLEIRTVQEATTAAAALQGGDIDLVLQIDNALIPTLKTDPSMQLLETAAGTSMTLSMWSDTPPFDDVRVRQALKKLVDRQEIVDTVLLGFGEAGGDNPIPLTDPLSYMYGQDAPMQDIEGAKALLAEAGYTEDNPLTIDLYSGEAVPGYTRLAQVFAEQAAKAGVIVNIIQAPADSYWDDTWLKKPFVNSGWTRRPVIVAEAMAYSCKSEYPETHWCRPEFDELLSKASSELDPEARTEALHAMQKMITEDGGAIIPVFMHIVAAMRSECSGYTPHVQNSNFDWSQIVCK